MSEQQIFEYESDWTDYFNGVLKNEVREEIDNRNLIKANIIESNQTLDSFLKRNFRLLYTATPGLPTTT